MREIKFRAWNKALKTMLDVSAIDFRPSEPHIIADYLRYPLHHPLSDCEILQYTGLKDENKVEIYEGDIIFNQYYEEYGQVDYACGCFVAIYDGWQHELSESNENSIILGNVYENSELIEKE